MGTGILQVGPSNAEIIGFKDFNFALKMLQGNPKNGIVLTHWHTIEWIKSEWETKVLWVLQNLEISFPMNTKTPDFFLKIQKKQRFKDAYLTSEKQKVSKMDHFYSSIKNL